MHYHRTLVCRTGVRPLNTLHLFNNSQCFSWLFMIIFLCNYYQCENFSLLTTYPIWLNKNRKYNPRLHNMQLKQLKSLPLPFQFCCDTWGDEKAVSSVICTNCRINCAKQVLNLKPMFSNNMKIYGQFTNLSISRSFFHLLLITTINYTQIANSSHIIPPQHLDKTHRPISTNTLLAVTCEVKLKAC